MLYLNFNILEQTSSFHNAYPFLNINNEVNPLSPIHCRSYIMEQMENGRYIVSKGNGLSFSQYGFLYTREFPSEIWGLLSKDSAFRDFNCCQDVQALGIKTNQMECILELEYPIYIPQTDSTLKPILLQYNVECPYRIADAGFMTQEQIWNEVTRWERMNNRNFQEEYLIAADVLIQNLHILHKNGILHNALTCENVTWALELVDFELCHTPQHPYTNEDSIRHLPDLFDRELIDTYKIICYIACVLHQTPDFRRIDELFGIYGFDIASFRVLCDYV